MYIFKKQEIYTTLVRDWVLKPARSIWRSTSFAWRYKYEELAKEKRALIESIFVPFFA